MIFGEGQRNLKQKGVRENLGRPDISQAQSVKRCRPLTEPGVSRPACAALPAASFPRAFAGAAAAAAIAFLQESADEQQACCVAAAPSADSVPDDYSVVQRADDHSVPVALPDDYSASVDCSERGG